MKQFEGSVWLQMKLLSDATFGRGDGVAGLVDAEVQHDEYGLPYLGGKTLKGLLAAECAEILYALERSGVPIEEWRKAAQFLFGDSGEGGAKTGRMIVSAAELPPDLRAGIQNDFRALYTIANKREREQKIGAKQRANLAALTAVRRQTAIDAESGAAKENTLRAMRVIVRDITLTAQLDFTQPAPARAAHLLAACVQSFHRAGTGRNRGRGRLQAALYDQPVAGKPLNWFADFSKEVQSESVDLSN